MWLRASAWRPEVRTLVKMAATQTTSLWRDHQFRTFWSAQSVSEFGDRITELALPLIAVTLLDALPTQVAS